jgi:hypothetical protein
VFVVFVCVRAHARTQANVIDVLLAKGPSQLKTLGNAVGDIPLHVAVRAQVSSVPLDRQDICAPVSFFLFFFFKKIALKYCKKHVTIGSFYCHQEDRSVLIANV